MKENNQISFNFYSGLFEQIYSITSLEAAFKAVKRNRGAPGIDGVTVEEFSRTSKHSLQELSENVKNWRYKPKPVKRVEIPKPNGGGTRKLGIPCVIDRIIQMSIKMALEPLIDPKFSNSSFGFRPGKSQAHAISLAREHVTSGREWVVDIDLSKFFDRICHDKLVSRLKLYFDDRRVLRLIGMTLRSGILENGKVHPSKEGSVQGSPLSPLLSNVVLDQLDKEMEKRGHKFCRFADDVNAFVKTEKAANRVMRSLTSFIEKKMKLIVNREKSQVSLSKGVKFLGMTIIAGTIAISKSSLDRGMERVKELTPRGTHLTIEKSIEKINRWYRGWSSYYKMTEYPAQLNKIEAHIRRRLRARFIRQQKKKRHLARKLVKMGANKKTTYKTIYSNKGIWALSFTNPLHKALPKSWFTQRGLFSRTEENHPHWKNKKEWIKLV